jgi:hypothetical protein
MRRNQPMPASRVIGALGWLLVVAAVGAAIIVLVV